MKAIRTLLVGLGGYGSHYVNAVLDHGSEMRIELVGTVDPVPESCNRYSEIQRICGPAFTSIEEFYSASSADLVIISTPIHLHESMAIAALEYGAVVLCEKPAAGSIQAGLAMFRASKKTGRPLLIGYQWSFTDTILQLKSRIESGEFGKCQSARIIGFWPRGDAYYNRNNWAGKLCAANGDWILDSPLNNALAHFAHNPLFVLGQVPMTVEAELYRINPIETFDTVALRSNLSGGTKLIFCASLAVPTIVGPLFQYEFESCTIVGKESGEFSICHHDGKVEILPPIEDTARTSVRSKLYHAASVARGESEPFCDIDDSLPQLRLVAGAHMSGSVCELPESLRQITGDIKWSREFLEALTLTYNTGLLPNETGIFPWSKPSKKIEVQGLSEFTGTGYEDI